MGHAVSMHAAMQFRARVGVNTPNARKILGRWTRGKRLDIELGAIDKLEKIGGSFR
jgi:hypothetical protein